MSCQKPKCCCDDPECCSNPAFTQTEWAEIAAEYGSEAARVVGDALSIGFSAPAIRDILELQGPEFLCQAVHSTKLARQLSNVIKEQPRGSVLCKPEQFQEALTKLGLGKDWRAMPGIQIMKKAAVSNTSDIFGRPPRIVGSFGDAPIIQGGGDDPVVPPAQVIDPSVFLALLAQVLPVLASTYGPQIITWLVQQLITALQTHAVQQQLTAALTSLPPMPLQK